MPLRQPGIGYKLLKTGQTTQYSSESDDGHYEAGKTKAYTVLSTGGYSGTSNIDLIHLTGAGIAFAATTPGTITDTGNGLAIFQTGDVLVVTGSGLNDGVYNISTGGVAGTIRTTEATLLEAAGATVSLAKREALSNNCVLDLNTGLMWARYTSAENAAMGAASDGKMPWTGELYDVFQWCAAANTASLGSYSDWRVPNVAELISLMDYEIARAYPDPTAFPSWPTGGNRIQTSTTAPANTGAGLCISGYGYVEGVAKTTVNYGTLVREGI